MELINENYLDVELLLYMTDEPDTIYYSNESHRTLSKAVINSMGLKIGDTLAYEHMQITSGTCTPDIFTLLLEPYSRSRSAK